VRAIPPSQHQGPSADIPAHSAAPARRRELLVVAVFILINSLTFFLIQYDRMRNANQFFDYAVRAILGGAYQAPEQYRVALPLLARFLSLHAHLRPNQSFPLIESLAYALTLWLLYLLLISSPQAENRRPTDRLVLLGLFLAAVQFPVLWIFPWDRTETLPTALYLAAIVLLVVRCSRIPFALVCVLAVLLSLGQALVRADVPAAAGAAVLLAAALAVPLHRPRTHVAALGLLCAAIAAGTQLYLQRVVFPHATYPANVPRFQLLTNLDPRHPIFHVPIVLTALLPLIVSLVWLRRYRLPFDPADKLVLLMCLVYLPVWFAMGLVVEVRIFVPYLFLAAPAIARVWAAFLLDDKAAAHPPHSAA
jgi:membrane-associated HD superfamily phosphohydrolase